MKVVLFELATIAAMFLCTIYAWCATGSVKNIGEASGEIIWNMFAERTGAAKNGFLQKVMKRNALSTSIALSEGTYIVSNRFSNDIYVDASGPIVKLYLNVQRGKVYVSIIKGHISIDNCTCYADQTTRVEIPEYSRVRIADVEVQFCRRGVS